MQRTISQVIERLSHIKSDHGDLPCYLQTSGGLCKDLSLQVEYAEDWNQWPLDRDKFVVIYRWEEEE